MHPRSKHWQLIDYVIIRKRDRQDVRVTKAISGAECWIDQGLIIAKLRLRIQPKRRPQSVKAPKRLNVNKMKTDTIKQSFAATLEERLEPIGLDNQDVEAAWGALRETVQHSHGVPRAYLQTTPRLVRREMCCDHTVAGRQALYLQSPPWRPNIDSNERRTEEHALHHPDEAASDEGLLIKQ